MYHPSCYFSQRPLRGCGFKLCILTLIFEFHHDPQGERQKSHPGEKGDAISLRSSQTQPDFFPIPLYLIDLPQYFFFRDPTIIHGSGNIIPPDQTGQAVLPDNPVDSRFTRFRMDKSRYLSETRFVMRIGDNGDDVAIANKRRHAPASGLKFERATLFQYLLHQFSQSRAGKCQILPYFLFLSPAGQVSVRFPQFFSTMISLLRNSVMSPTTSASISFSSARYSLGKGRDDIP